MMILANSKVQQEKASLNILVTEPAAVIKRQQQEVVPALPSVLTDFIAVKLCELIRIRPIPIGAKRRAPELLYFILTVTSQARISCQNAIVALIYIERCKKALPRNAVGDQDTIHRIFIASILVASKFLNGACSSSQEGDYIMKDSNILLTNTRMADICSRFYTLEEINQLELSFLSLIKFNCFVSPSDIQQYLIENRQDLLL